MHPPKHPQRPATGSIRESHFAQANRVVNTNGSYTVANTLVINGSSQIFRSQDGVELSAERWRHPGGRDRLPATMPFQFFSLSIPLSTRYSLQPWRCRPARVSRLKPATPKVTI
jgi:hypothetical protein